MTFFFSVKNQQTDILKRIFRLNKNTEDESPHKEGTIIETWKILIIDAVAKAIISPLLTTAQLKRLGITVVHDITAHRQPIYEAPAIYIVQPTPENIELISEDAKAQRYDSMYLNFISPVELSQLTELAKRTSEDGTSNLITKVFDHYFDFITYEHNLFSLRMENSFLKMHDKKMAPGDRDIFLNSIATSLSHVFLTMQSVPIIKCSNSPNVKKITELLTEHMRSEKFVEAMAAMTTDSQSSSSSSSSFSSSASSASGGIGLNSAERPLLLILDRTSDVTPAIQHQWAYLSLINELLDYRPGRVSWMSSLSLTAGDKADAKAGKKMAIVNFDSDEFWRENIDADFELISERIQEMLTQYKDDAEHIKQRYSAGDDGSTGAQAADLMQDLNPLTVIKTTLDNHTLIATEVTSRVHKRILDHYAGVERELMEKRDVTGNALELLAAEYALRGTAYDQFDTTYTGNQAGSSSSDSSASSSASASSTAAGELARTAAPAMQTKGTFSDMIRLLCIAYLSGADCTPFRDAERQIENWKHGLFPALRFVRHLYPNVAPAQQGAGSFLARLTKKASFDYVIPKIAKDVMNGTSSAESDSLLTYDPIQDSATASSSTTPARQIYRKVIVFVVGGGTTAEYLNLMQYAKANGKELIFGCTELLTPDKFMSQLASLGRIVFGDI
ncbi:Sly1 [Monocercomonoides exilis]|uniref:Sly1 n=1 Tax=Monocercomonoides exilis TaxID=2049356 RepID=UPI003559735F|nr:Sly1 [Monocercomonoides exilis]|eukprot:MONOS_199.1-p1 / transcript=MONOS_199.1 / gene=MONOS_199 / organism=Monocercomonoides_exilis_PA203 / gene_product= Sly1 / transcript_product= Sly1 / location=Mono_scaffold00003:238684-241391(+) / protein_length=674 / sequence_SO=supercontig / SO=protein_coding / is_pseudo=false